MLDIRARLHLPPRPEQPSDHLLVAQSARRTIALPVEEVLGVITCPAADIVPAAVIFPGVGHLLGVARRDDGLLIIQDLDTFLYPDESAQLDRVLEGEPP